jgi:hypothetical protein
MALALPRGEADDVQGLALHGHGELGECRYFLLKIRDARAARRWLSELLPAVGRGRGVSPGTALTVAFTHAGLRALGLNESVLAGFSRELAEGLVNETRSVFLGDVANSAPTLWRWGGPNNPTLHVLLGAFADTLPRLVGLLGHVHASLLPGGLSKLFEIETARLPSPDVFRCADGSTPPMLAGHAASSPEPTAPGELLLGYPNRHGRYAARPLVPAALDPMARLSLDREGSARHDLGRNGSYLVLRQLRQNLDAWERAQPFVLDSGVTAANTGDADVLAPARHLTLRNRSYGPPVSRHEGTGSARLDDAERGVCLLALNADLSSQFELMQRWSLLDPRYSALFGDVPAVALGLAGEGRCPGSEPIPPGRRNQPSSVDVVGGAYFFLPSLRALGYLAGLTA